MLSVNSKAKSYDDLSNDDKKLYNERKKQKILGNMNFIGELFVNNLISKDIIH
jgi:hypothetical protein